MSHFSSVGRISYEGSRTTSPLAFQHYNPEQLVAGKKMEEHLRFSLAYWHSLTGGGSDPFGSATAIRPWDRFTGMDLAKARVEAAFEMMDKLGIRYFAFHDRDIAPEGDTLQETNRNLDVIVEMIEQHMQSSGAKLLWNTACLFTHPRFVHGAGTASNADVYAYSAA
ncbi:MAG: xylose isomerase, partial [Paenibacillus sp.]|nr:xylose isomerase [Paenibacillus sp.]